MLESSTGAGAAVAKERSDDAGAGAYAGAAAKAPSPGAPAGFARVHVSFLSITSSPLSASMATSATRGPSSNSMKP